MQQRKKRRQNYPPIGVYQKFFGIKLFFSLFILLLLPHFFIKAYGEQPSKQESQDITSAKEGKKFYKVRFFALKRRHSIGPTTFVLNDNGTFTLLIDNEELLSQKGDYTINNFAFEGNVEFSIQKNKPYHFAFHFSGISLFNANIVGLLKVKEYLHKSKIIQEIPFLFFATRYNQDETESKKRTPFF